MLIKNEILNLADDEAGQSYTTEEVEERRIKEAYNILEVNSY
jgi:hypothetical protein